MNAEIQTENPRRDRAYHLSKQVFAISHSILRTMNTERPGNWLKREKIVNGTCFSVRNNSFGKSGQPFQATH